MSILYVCCTDLGGLDAIQLGLGPAPAGPTEDLVALLS